MDVEYSPTDYEDFLLYELFYFSLIVDLIKKILISLLPCLNKHIL